MGEHKPSVVPVDSKKVPIPQQLLKYPFATMKVGDSFTVSIKDRKNVSARASRVGAETGKKFTVRKIDENTLRVWRTE